METIITLIDNNAIIAAVVTAVISLFVAWLTFEKLSSEVTDVIVRIAAIMAIGGLLAGGFFDIIGGEFAPKSIQSINAISYILGLSFFLLNLIGIGIVYVAGAICGILCIAYHIITFPFTWFYKKIHGEVTAI